MAQRSVVRHSHAGGTVNSAVDGLRPAESVLKALRR